MSKDNSIRGLRISERMAGWISFNESAVGSSGEKKAEKHAEKQTPFEIQIHAFTSNLLQFPLKLSFKGKAYFLGTSSPSKIKEGVLTINPIRGVGYDFSLDTEDRGKLFFVGQKDYQWTLNWKYFRDSLITLPLEVKNSEMKTIGQARLVYLEPLWHFPFGLGWVREKYAFCPRRKLAEKIARLDRIVLSSDFTPGFSNKSEIVDLIERQLNVSKIWIYLSIWISFLIFSCFIKLKFRKKIENLDEFEQEIISQRLAKNSFCHIVTLPFFTFLTSALFSSTSYLKSQRQNIVTPPKFLEEEKWMAFHQTPTVQIGQEELEVDAVVVGSGAGGAAAAYELSRQGHTVALIEEGHYFKRTDMTGNRIDMMEKLYQGSGQTFVVSNAPLWIPTGKCVGGTTVINCGTSIRTPQKVIRRWEDELGLKDLGIESFFEVVEKVLDVKPTPSELQKGISDVLRKGIKDKPYALHSLPRGETGCDGQGFCILGCPTGAKRSTDVSFIPEMLKNNSFLFSHYTVNKILMDGSKAIGVKAHLQDYGPEFSLTIKAKKVILAGGTFKTPVLVSQIPQGKKLKQLGKNLSIHPAISVGGLFKEKVRETLYVPQALGIFNLPHDRFVFEGYTFTADTIPPAFTSYGKELQKIMTHLENFASFGTMLKDATYGHLVFCKDQAFPCYFLNKETINRLQEALSILTEFFLQANATTVYLPVRGFNKIESFQELTSFQKAKLAAHHFSLSAHHPLGTCRMGNDPENSVVDRFGAVWGTENLYVVDGSVIPGPLEVNPQITIMSNALRIAQHIGSSL